MMKIEQAYVMDFIKNLIDSKELRRNCKLGEGSAREAYKLNDELVLKIPRGALYSEDERYEKEVDTRFLYGVHQTQVEIDVWNNSDEFVRQVLNPIILHGQFNDFTFEVQPMVTIAEDTDYAYEDIVSFAELIGGDFVEEDTFDSIADFLIDCFSLGEGDILDNCGNYGITSDNRVVLVDYGFQGWSKIQAFVDERMDKSKSKKHNRRVRKYENSDTLWSDSTSSSSW